MPLLRWSVTLSLVIFAIASCSAIQPSGFLVIPGLQPATATPSSTLTARPTSTPVPSPTPSKAHVWAGTVQKDLIYGVAEGVDLKLDLYFPNRIGSKLLPAVLYVHGGSWVSGDKAGTFAEIEELVRRGYLVASVNYRLAPQWKFPAQIEDVKCAVRYLRAHAAEYHLDPNRIGAYGASAGGHLVALLGTTDSSAGMEGKGGYPEYSSRVQAVIDSFGPTDFTLYGAKLHPRNKDVFGAASLDDPIIARISPLTYVSKDDPPFLILHGDKDEMVVLKHSENLVDKLKNEGVPASLVVVKNAGHGFNQPGVEVSPSFTEVLSLIGNFFDEHLR
jgi:acetyl esterase/lipase